WVYADLQTGVLPLQASEGMLQVYTHKSHTHTHTHTHTNTHTHRRCTHTHTHRRRTHTQTNTHKHTHTHKQKSSVEIRFIFSSLLHCIFHSNSTGSDITILSTHAPDPTHTHHLSAAQE